MKSSILLILFLFTLPFFTLAQLVESSCNITPEIESFYRKDANRIALKISLERDTTYQDSLQINNNLSDSILTYLAAIYNATSLPARDTVVNDNTHTWNEPEMNGFSLSANNSFLWMENLKNKILPCGYDSLDQIIEEHGFSIQYVIERETYNSISFETPNDLNAIAIARKVKRLSQVESANEDWWAYAVIPDNIQFHFDSNFVNIAFTQGFSPTSARTWFFKVFDDCSVDFEKSSGSPYGFDGLIDVVDVSIDEKNISDTQFFLHKVGTNGFKIIGLTRPAPYSIYNLNGQVVQKGIIYPEKTELLGYSDTGLFLVHLKNQNLTLYLTK